MLLNNRLLWWLVFVFWPISARKGIRCIVLSYAISAKDFRAEKEDWSKSPGTRRLDQGEICWQLLAIPRKTVAGRHVIFGRDCPFALLLFFVSIILMACKFFFPLLAPSLFEWPVGCHKKKVKWRKDNDTCWITWSPLFLLRLFFPVANSLLMFLFIFDCVIAGSWKYYWQERRDRQTFSRGGTYPLGVGDVFTNK